MVFRNLNLGYLLVLLNISNIINHCLFTEDQTCKNMQNLYACGLHQQKMRDSKRLARKPLIRVSKKTLYFSHWKNIKQNTNLLKLKCT